MSLSDNVASCDVKITRGYRNDKPYFLVDGYTQDSSKMTNERDPYLDLIQSVTLVQPRIFEKDKPLFEDGNNEYKIIVIRFLGPNGPIIKIPDHTVSSLMWLQDYELEDLCFEIASEARIAFSAFEDTVTIESKVLRKRLESVNE